MQVGALVLAAGRGDRLGSEVPKAFVSLRGRTLLDRSLATLRAVSLVDQVVPVVPAAHVNDVPGAVAGGAERQDSVRAGLDALEARIDWVAVHDAARCLVTVAEIESVIEAARETGAAILAIPSPDTVKIVSGDRIASTPERSSCWIAQTPQVFRVELLREAMGKARAEGFLGTDDAQLVERLGVAVRVVSGSARNLKITRPEDLRIAEALLAESGS